MGYPLNDLGTALTTQIYHTVMGGDDKVPPPKNTFFTWAMPGLPFTENDFDFVASGIYSAPTADELKARLTHAFNLATLMDFIPDVGAPYSNERQEGMYKPDAEKRLSEMYRQILRFAKVVNDELTDQEKEKLAKFRSFLFTTKKVKDIITDEEKEVTEDGPALKAYNEKMAAYLAAALEYNAKRIAAAAATGPEGRILVADFSMNAQLYYQRVKAAADAWVSAGYRNDIDQINAYINAVTERSMVMWKQQLEETYDKGVITGTDVPIPFRYTTLVPGNLATAGGWTQIGISHNTVDWAKHNTSTSWSAGAGLKWGLFGFGGTAGGSSAEQSVDFQVNSFSLSFELAQALVARPWFYPEWFANRGWTLRAGEGWTFDLPSDGGSPPTGSFIGYPTQALFVRNVQIKSAEFASAYRAAQSQWGVDANIGWGPFKLSGGYHRTQSDEKFHSVEDGQTLTVPGMQIIGFVNHLVGKTPNPLPELKDTDFV